MRCLINISSAAFLSEMCPLTLLLTHWQMWARIQDHRCSSVPVFHLGWEESGASGGDGEVWARPQWVRIWFLIFIAIMDGWRSSKQTRYLLGSAISGRGKRRKASTFGACGLMLYFSDQKMIYFLSIMNTCYSWQQKLCQYKRCFGGKCCSRFRLFHILRPWTASICKLWHNRWLIGPFSPSRRDVKTSWTLWPSRWWISGPGWSCGSPRAGTKTDTTSRSRSTTRAEPWTSPPRTETRANTALCPGWRWKPGSTGSIMSPKPTSTALWKQVRLQDERKANFIVPRENLSRALRWLAVGENNQIHHQVRL